VRNGELSVRVTEAAHAGAELVCAERRRVARGLHDSPIQLLAAASLRLQAAALHGDAVPSAVDTAAREVEQAITALREIMQRLASTDVEPEVVDDALARLDAPGIAPSRSTPFPLSEAAALVVSRAGDRVEGPCNG
jgi:signal transduction histidine kinase